MASEYMHWAKTRQSAPCNLAASGILAVERDEFPFGLEEVAINAPGRYGSPELLAAIATRYGSTPDRVVLSAGTSGANHLAMAVLIEPGDEVLIEEPGYPLLVETAQHLGGIVRRFPRRPGDRFALDAEAVAAAITPRTRLIVLSDLHNPTMARASAESLRRVGELAERNGARVLVDEVYLDAAFDPSARSAAVLSDAVVTTSSLTKVYGLSGLRCGWVLAAPDLAVRMWRLNDLFGVNAAAPAEALALVAFRRLASLAERARRLLDANRPLLEGFLASRDDLVWEGPVSGTAAFPRWTGGDVEGLCERLRREEHTSVVPGRFFGAPDRMRIGIGGRTEEVAEGLRRLGRVLDAGRAMGAS